VSINYVDQANAANHYTTPPTVTDSGGKVIASSSNTVGMN